MKIYKIWDNKEHKYCSAYSRSYHDEIEWDSEDHARNAHCVYNWKDTSRYSCHIFDRIDRRIS